MKLLALCLFGWSTGAISAFAGLSFMDNPLGYAMINFPLILCFAIVLTMIEEAGE